MKCFLKVLTLIWCLKATKKKKKKKTLISGSYLILFFFSLTWIFHNEHVLHSHRGVVRFKREKTYGTHLANYLAIMRPRTE